MNLGKILEATAKLQITDSEVSDNVTRIIEKAKQNEGYSETLFVNGHEIVVEVFPIDGVWVAGITYRGAFELIDEYDDIDEIKPSDIEDFIDNYVFSSFNLEIFTNSIEEQMQTSESGLVEKLSADIGREFTSSEIEGFKSIMEDFASAYNLNPNVSADKEHLQVSW